MDVSYQVIYLITAQDYVATKGGFMIEVICATNALTTCVAPHRHLTIIIHPARRKTMCGIAFHAIRSHAAGIKQRGRLI
jgi:hypothetical protein